MGLIIVTFLVMAVVILLMAVGVICGQEPLKGSCGGLNKIGIDGKCDICGREPNSCESEKASSTEHEGPKPNYQLGYDALSKNKSNEEK